MFGPGTHGMPKLAGWSNLLLSSVINAEEISAGDRVSVLTLPNGQYFLAKNETDDTVLVAEVTLSHILFSGLEVEEADVRED